MNKDRQVGSGSTCRGQYDLCAVDSPTMPQNETNRMIERIFAVAEILARGHVVPESLKAQTENRSKNHERVDLQYGEAEVIQGLKTGQ